MDKLAALKGIREKLASGSISLGSWMQISNGSVAEIMGDSGFDWIAADLEHGAFSIEKLPDIFRALELGDCLPLVRLAQQSAKDCKHALDCGAAGVIVPNIKSSQQLEQIRSAIAWPPSGTRGIGFSRTNLYGKRFIPYTKEAQAPFLVAMIEDLAAIENLPEILSVEGLDAVLIGPYDLSASIGVTGGFNEPQFLAAIAEIKSECNKKSVPVGIHVVKPDLEGLQDKIGEGYQFIAYGIDSVFLSESCVFPNLFIN
jgi:2-dehydro-3-deoxyglucarate aldolase